MVTGKLGNQRGGGGQCYPLVCHPPQRDVVADRGQGAARVGHEGHLVAVAVGVQGRGDAADLGANPCGYELA